MFCKQCGHSIADGMMFCPACGTAVEAATVEMTQVVAEESAVAEPVYQPVAEPVYQPVAEPVYQPVQKAKKGKKGLIATIVAVVAVVALAAVAILTPIKNVFIGLMPAEKHMQYVYANAAKTLGEDVGEVYGTVLSKTDASNATSGTFELQLASTLMSQIESMIGVELGDLNKVAIDYAIVIDKDNECGYTLALKLQDKELLTLKMYLDLESGEAVIEVPDILEKPIKVDAIDPEELTSVDAALLTNLNTESLLDENYISELIPRLIRVSFEQITNVQRGKEAFKADSVEQTATCFDAYVTTQTVAKMANAVIEELKNDEGLKDAIIGFCDDNAKLLGDVEGDEIYDSFTEALMDGQEELMDVEDDKELFSFKTWVDGANDIIALEMTMQDGEIFIGKAMDGEEVGYEISATDGDTEMLSIVGEGTEKKDVLAAEFIVEVEGEEYIKLVVEDYDLKKAEEGYLNGVFTLIPGKALTEMESMIANAALKITTEMSENNAELIVDVQMQGASLGTIRLTAGIDEAADVTVPSGTIDAEDVTADMIDMQAILDKLEDAGISEEMINSLTAMLMGGSADSSDDYSGDYDDYSGDYDDDDFYGLYEDALSYDDYL